MTNNPSTNLLRLVLVTAGIAWGLTIAVTPWQVESGWHSMVLIFWQSVVSAVALGLWMVISKRPFPIGPRVVVFYIGMSLAGTAIPQVLSLESGDQLAVSVRSIIFALIPMASLAFGVLFRVEVITWQKLLGLVLGFLAMLMIALFGADSGGFGGGQMSFFWFGVMLFVVALYAFENNWVKLTMPRDMNPFVALMGANLFAIFFLGPFMPFLGDQWMWLPIEFTGEHARPTAMFWLVTALHLASYGGLVFCINKGGPAFAGQVSYIVTASGVLWGLLLLDGERLTWPIILALFIVMGGLALVKPNDT